MIKISEEERACVVRVMLQKYEEFKVNKSTISIPVKNVAYYLMENENE